jgi:hypothetical protein
VAGATVSRGGSPRGDTRASATVWQPGGVSNLGRRVRLRR